MQNAKCLDQGAHTESGGGNGAHRVQGVLRHQVGHISRVFRSVWCTADPSVVTHRLAPAPVAPLTPLLTGF